METYKTLSFRPFVKSDIKAFTPIMAKAFDKDTQEFLDLPHGGPKGYNDGSFLTNYGLDPTSTALAFFLKDQPIGVIIAWIEEGGEAFLGNLFIDPIFQDQGYGSIAWQFLQEKYPTIKIWRTETPAYSRRNHVFYVNKCGFHIVKIKSPNDLENCSYAMEKKISH